MASFVAFFHPAKGSTVRTQSACHRAPMCPPTPHRDVAMLHFFSSAGDEGQAALAVVQASQKDCGVYQCVISNEYGTDSTDFLLSPEGEEPSAASHSCLGVPWVV